MTNNVNTRLLNIDFSKVVSAEYNQSSAGHNEDIVLKTSDGKQIVISGFVDHKGGGKLTIEIDGNEI